MNPIRAIISRVSMQAQIQRVIRAQIPTLKSDHNFDLERIRGGLQPRVDGNDDTHILDRIVRAYQKAKSLEREAPSAYRVSNEWLPIYNRQLGPVMKALSSGDVLALSAMYKNFYRDPCSTGLVGLPVSSKRYLGKRARKQYKLFFLSDTIYRYNLWRRMIGQGYAASDLACPDIGNPFGYELDGVFVRTGADYQHFYATRIQRLVGSDTVVELGGGYGGMAYYLLRDSRKTTYIDFDLPENMALAAYYLIKAFPNERITLYGEADFGPGTISASRIWILPSFEMRKMADNSAKLVFNSYSLAEMSAEAIREYVVQLTRITERYFLHVNHNKHAMVRADQFGIEEYGFDLVSRQLALWNQGRTMDVDEYEYLYKKTSKTEPSIDKKGSVPALAPNHSGEC